MKRCLKITAVIIFTCSILTASLFAQEIKEHDKEFTVKAGHILEANIKGDVGELYIRSSKKHFTGRVITVYEPRDYDYDFFYDEEHSELFVTLDKDELLRNYDSDKEEAEIEAFLPLQVPVNLDVEIKAGVLDLNLTGVKLEDFELNSWAGETRVYFGELNTQRLDYMKIDVNIGDVKIEGLGYANFENAFIDGGIGSLLVDLVGEYHPGEHHIKIDLDIGEANIILPRDVGIRMSVSKPPLIGHLTMDANLRKRGKFYYSRGFDNAETKLFIRVEMGIGECTIR